MGTNLKYDFKNKLQLSLTFFKTCTITLPEALRKRAFNICDLSENQIEQSYIYQTSISKYPDLPHILIGPQWLDLSNALFETCVFTDILNGNDNPEASKYITEIKTSYIKFKYMPPEERKKVIESLEF